MSVKINELISHLFLYKGGNVVNFHGNFHKYFNVRIFRIVSKIRTMLNTY